MEKLEYDTHTAEITSLVPWRRAPGASFQVTALPSPPVSSSPCPVGLVPRWVVVECIGKRWVLRPERRVLVEFGGNPADPTWDGPRVRLFFSVGATLGLVCPPVPVSDLADCVGRLGGTSAVRGSGSCAAPKRFEATQTVVADLTTRGPTLVIKSMRNLGEGYKACCNTKWVVIANPPSDNSNVQQGMHVWRVKNSRVEEAGRRFMRCTWSASALSLRFLGQNEFDFEADVVEAIFTEKREGEHEYLCVAHIDLSTAEIHSRVVCACNLSEKGISTRAITRPLVNRSDWTYCFVLLSSFRGYYSAALKILVVNTGKIITLLEEYPCRDITVATTDESHLCITSKSCSRADVYSLSSFLLFLFIILFAKLASGCGLIAISSLSMDTDPFYSVLIPTLSETSNPSGEQSFHTPKVTMTHQIIDSTTGTLIFSQKQTGTRRSLLPLDIKAVPFRCPFTAQH
ncbi:hypothetical protein Pelo_4177 [Pelomyxa schiedti]|nr:hypothetical protein Pelo_4177 [Pelomyxa schiedti]